MTSALLSLPICTNGLDQSGFAKESGVSPKLSAISGSPSDGGLGHAGSDYNNNCERKRSPKKK
jgi:hypothetical protein